MKSFVNFSVGFKIKKRGQGRRHKYLYSQWRVGPDR